MFVSGEPFHTQKFFFNARNTALHIESMSFMPAVLLSVPLQQFLSSLHHRVPPSVTL